LAETFSDFRAALADRYRLERELGRGGMATVYLAHDLRHDRPVALKVLLPEIARALGPERFEREIKLAARLQHPHIVTVYDSGEAIGQLWFTMPYVAGESLRDRLFREKQLPVDDALHIAREVAEALEYAHRQGVVHRDIKPENILLAGNHALVADFGIARALGAGDPQLTGTGVAIGTPLYMSPEQASGSHDVDARTDIYALGCVLFEMLAGEPPYTGPTPQAIMARALTERPRPIHPARVGLPATVDAVITKAMSATPADRYSDAGALAGALELATRPQDAARDGVSLLRTAARRPLFPALALGFLLGVGALFAWRRSHAVDASGPNRIAVLPFENLGDSANAYFADGMTDAVRGKLSELPGLEVTARYSSSQYKATTKTPRQIGQELGVQYLLTATVRWENGPDRSSRVLVTPELVRVSSSSTRWQAPFDASITDVFAVQSEIAGRVAQALNLVLGDSARQRLAEKPTRNLAAYDAYLKGEEISQGLGVSDPATMRRAVPFYAQAVALDSDFVQAWGHLSRAHSILYFNSTPTPSEAEQALQAARRALALAPDRAEGHAALGYYYYSVDRDNARAVEELGQAQRAAPNDASLLIALAQPELALGRWDAGREHLQRAQTLDPRSVFASGGSLTWVLLSQRRYPEARAAADHMFALAPTNLGAVEDEAMVALAQGDLAEARAVTARLPKEVDLTALVARLADAFDLCWVLDQPQQALLLQLTPSAWDGDRGRWGIILAQTYWLRGDRARARIYADSARLAIEQQLQAAPQDAETHVWHGLALAYVGRKTEAMREGQRGVAMMPIAMDALVGPYLQHQLARIYIVVDEPEKALDQLEPLLRMPYYLSPSWLKIDPNFDPLRNNPRFQRLVAGGS
jgi:serine/threonine-protein kinase